MHLILWRHAEAADEAPSDLARQLTDKGKLQAERMALWLRAQLGPDLNGWRVISSPAIRTQQTAASLHLPMEIVNEVAPGASVEAVLAAAAWPGAKRSTIVIGHQPTLGMVAARLINGVDGYVSVKKGAIWWFETRERDGKCKTVLRAMATPESVV